jgi:hypothetical protein
MLKSQQLLLKHNLDSAPLKEDEDEKVVLKRILKQKKANAKMQAIASILQTFFVGTVFMRAQDCVYLEILGSAVNVEIAEHVANVLEVDFENLWNQARRSMRLKGMTAKNSFFLGLAKGYCHKVQAFQREYDSHETTALMVIEKKLVDAREMVYPRLSSTKRRLNHCSASSAVGESMGKQLNINPAIKKGPTSSGTLIAYTEN